jgi:hypothetical protein
MTKQQQKKTLPEVGTIKWRENHLCYVFYDSRGLVEEVADPKSLTKRTRLFLVL